MQMIPDYLGAAGLRGSAADLPALPKRAPYWRGRSHLPGCATGKANSAAFTRGRDSIREIKAQRKRIA